MKTNFLYLGLLAILWVFPADPANAQFEKSDETVFLGALELSDELQPGTEYYAHAIVQPGGENTPVVYIIYYNHKGDVRVLGAFRCDKRFEVVNSVTNNLRDIRCDRQNVFGQQMSVLLKADESGMYAEFQE